MLARTVELLLLFGALPAAMRWGPLPRNPLPLLALGAVATGVLLARDPSFDRRLFWNGGAIVEHAGTIAVALAISAPLLYLLMRRLVPDEAFAMVRQRPRLWLAIMIAYPIVSVYPQELLYRAWFFHRYAALLGSPRATIVASAVAFAWGHVFFPRPRVAMLLTLAGGLLFAHDYVSTQSLCVASVEHALFGDLLFTIGLGRFFYHRAVDTLAAPAQDRARP